MNHYFFTYLLLRSRTQITQKITTCSVRSVILLGHNTNSKRLIYSDYPASLIRSQWKMSTDGGSRVDQYFVKYTEVNFIIRYRLNLNLGVRVCQTKKFVLRDIIYDLNENLYVVRKCFVNYCDSSGWALRRGVCPFLYLHRVPCGMRAVSPPVIATTVSRTNTSAT